MLSIVLLIISLISVAVTLRMRAARIELERQTAYLERLAGELDEQVLELTRERERMVEARAARQ